MTLDLLIFGPAAAAAGADRVSVRVPDEPAGATAAAVLRAAADQHPALADLAASRGARLAINHEFAAPHDRVRPGDELALIAMVSGG